MALFALVVNNLARRPGRSLLTVSGVAVGLGAVVVLVSLAHGFERSWGAVYEAGQVDLVVGRSNSRRPLPTPFPETTVAALRALPRVEEAAAVITDMLSVDDAPAVLFFGWEPGSFLWDHLQLIDGRWPVAGERALALGTVLAGRLGKSAGDTVRLLESDYLVCGRFASPAFSENGSVVMTLEALQDATARDGDVNFVTLRLRPGAGAVEEVRREVRAQFAGFSAESIGEVLRSNIAVQAAKSMSLAVSLVAAAVGVLGIMNTVLMSVFERRREIAVLMAIGWGRARVIRMVVIESGLLSAAGGLAGAGGAVLALRALQSSAWFSGRLDTTPGPWLLAGSLLAAVALGAVCGVYPGWRAARVSVAEGLHHE